METLSDNAATPSKGCQLVDLHVVPRAADPSKRALHVPVQCIQERSLNPGTTCPQVIPARKCRNSLCGRDFGRQRSHRPKQRESASSTQKLRVSFPDSRVALRLANK